MPSFFELVSSFVDFLGICLGCAQIGSSDRTGLAEDNVFFVFYSVGSWNSPDTVQIKKAVDGLDRLVSKDWDKSDMILTSDDTGVYLRCLQRIGFFEIAKY